MTKQDNKYEVEWPIKISLYALGISGCLAPVLYALQSNSVSQFCSILGFSLMISSAALFAGGLIGFLFGMPKTVSSTPGIENTESYEGLSRYTGNTNLEQVSDWLTKVLVGIGLTQLTNISEMFNTYMEFSRIGFGEFSGSRIFAGCLLIYFSIGGFLISFLLAKLYMVKELVKATMSAKFIATQNKLTEMEQQSESDITAVALVNKVLSTDQDSHGISQEDLSTAIKLATTNAKKIIFYEAQEVRSQNWDDYGTKPKMARSISVFKALIDADKNDEYDDNHAQLAYALKDQRLPDWKGALQQLNQAIKIRDLKGKGGRLFYEFNRAKCLINLDAEFRENKESKEESKKLILEDLNALEESKDKKRLTLLDGDIQKWKTLNGIK